MPSAPPAHLAPDAQAGQTIDRDREELYRRLAKIDKHLDASLWDRAPSETAQAGLRTTIDLLPYPALVRFNGRVDHANAPAAAVLAAGSTSDLIGLPWRDLLHPEDRPLPGIRPAHRLGDLDQPVKRFVRRDGVTFEVTIREAQIPWRGRTAGLIVIGEWNNAPGEEPTHGLLGPVAVRALDAAGEGVWEYDLRTGRLDISPRLEALLGYAHPSAEPPDPSAAPFFPTHDWQSLIHPEDRARSERRLRDHMAGREPLYDCDLRMQRGDGGYLWLHVRGAAQRDPAGRVQRLAGLACDATERQAQERERMRSEARAEETQIQLADAMNLAGDGFGLFDAGDRLVVHNQRLKAIFPEIANFIVKGAFFEDILSAALDAGAIVVAEQDRARWLQDRLVRHQSPTGSYVEQASDGRHVRFTECRLSSGGTVIICADITPLKRAERDLEIRVAELEAVKATLESQSDQLKAQATQLAEARDTADLANRAKSEFLANMSHELRTPLNAVMGFSEVIKNELFGPVGTAQYIDCAGDIYTSGAHLLEIINDILDLSKIEAGRLELSAERVDLREVADAVMRLVRPRAEADGVILVNGLTAGLPNLDADKRKLKQMLLNLLSNAVKFTPESGTVDLNAFVREDGGLTVCVRDTGIGIDPDQFDVVLSPFGQIDSALAREHQGTGLGLPLVKALVEAHEGSIELDSAVGRGTEVSLHFPASRSRPVPG